MELETLSILLVYGAMAAYTVAMVAFSIDLFRAAPGASAEKQRAGNVAMSTTWLAAGLHLLALALRTAAAGRVPWANMYEFTLTFTFIAIATFLALNMVRDMRFLGALINLSIVLGLGLATSVLYVRAEGVEPILDDYWLIIHVSVATLSTALLHIGAVMAVLQLAQHRAEKHTIGASPRIVSNVRTRRKSQASRVQTVANTQNVMTMEQPKSDQSSAFLRIMSTLPSAGQIEIWVYRLIGVGFVTWTFTIIAGAIWAEHAWGRPWGWDPKETWSFIVWVIYAGYLHARATVGWTAEKFAYFVLVGFVAVLVNFYLVNLFIPGNHSYAF